MIFRRLFRFDFLSLFLAVAALRAAEISVRTPAEFRDAVSAAQPGTRIVVASGEYGGGFHFSNVRGEPGKPIVIASADAKNPATFSQARTAIHFSRPAYLELHDLAFSAISTNGLNIDDGGATQAEDAAHHIVLRGLRVTDIGGGGNEDGIKLSGVNDFEVRDCVIERWGTGGGSAIDMVGCHRGLIEGCMIRHTAEPNCTGVQCKGGSSDIAIRANRFAYAGGRAVNIGGSTGLPFFRPPVNPAGENAEARRIVVEGNHFVGGTCAVAFVGAEDSVVRFNTIEQPGRWALRILQENRAAGFIPCRNGRFTDNVIVFESARWGEGGVNIGPGAAAASFHFARNWWFCSDRPARSTPRLPAAEADGVYGREPAGATNLAGASAFGRK